MLDSRYRKFDDQPVSHRKCSLVQLIHILAPRWVLDSRYRKFRDQPVSHRKCSLDLFQRIRSLSRLVLLVRAYVVVVLLVRVLVVVLDFLHLHLHLHQLWWRTLALVPHNHDFLYRKFDDQPLSHRKCSLV